jgi:hypothetical protein
MPAYCGGADQPTQRPMTRTHIVVTLAAVAAFTTACSFERKSESLLPTAPAPSTTQKKTAAPSVPSTTVRPPVRSSLP